MVICKIRQHEVLCLRGQILKSWLKVCMFLCTNTGTMCGISEPKSRAHRALACNNAVCLFTARMETADHSGTGQLRGLEFLTFDPFCVLSSAAFAKAQLSAVISFQAMDP